MKERQPGFYIVQHYARDKREVGEWHPLGDGSLGGWWLLADTRNKFGDEHFTYISPDPIDLHPDRQPESYDDWQQRELKKYAFPGQMMGMVGDQEQMIPVQGMSKREYFAAHAPERPSWFSIVSKINKPKEPKMWTDLPDDNPHKKELGEWMHDPCYDLPEELRWYQYAWEKHFKDMREYESLTERELYFSWRVYYADALLKQLES